MRALILAAGRGKRLSQTRPKPLTPLLGLTLIERSILSARKHGVKDFVIVVGYRADDIISHLGSGERLGVNISYVENKEWKKENGLSLLMAREELEGEDFLLLMSDHVFDDEALGLLLENHPNNCSMLVSHHLEDIPNLEDATKLLIENGVPVSIGKELRDYNAVDCGIFYCNPEIFKALQRSISLGEYGLSDAVQILIDQKKIDTLDMGRRFWCDVDTHDCLKYAEKKMLESLTKPGDGPISRHMNRKISTKITKLFTRGDITPNQLSFLVFALSILSAVVFFMMDQYEHLIIGGILVQLSSILDGCDGELARIKLMESDRGRFIDSVLDRYADALIILGLCYGSWRMFGGLWIWLVGFVALTGSILFSYTNARWEAVFSREESAGIPIRRDLRLFMIMIGALVNQVLIALLVIAVLTHLEISRRLLSSAHDWRNKSDLISENGLEDKTR